MQVHALYLIGYSNVVTFLFFLSEIFPEKERDFLFFSRNLNLYESMFYLLW